MTKSFQTFALFLEGQLLTYGREKKLRGYQNQYYT